MKYAIAMMLLLTSFGAFAAPAVSTLSWDAPTTRVDGTPFSIEDIQEYRVTYTIDGEVAGDRSPVILDFAATDAEIVLNLSPREMPYTVEFQIVVVDKQGRVSLPSDPVSKVFAVDSTAAPYPPSSVQFTVTCGEDCVIEEIVKGQ